MRLPENSSPIARKHPPEARGRWARSVSNLFTPVDNDFLGYFRVLFGLLMLWQVLDYFSVQANGRTIISNYYIRPFHFTYYGFGWVRPWPGDGMFLHFGLMALLAVGVLVGFLYRFCAVLFCLGWVYLFLLDKAYYQNHYYLICLLSFWMAMLPANRVFSLDAALQPAIRATTVPAWMLWVLRLQIGIPYFFGGLAKINHDWLHGEPMRHWIFVSSNKYAYVKVALIWWYGDDWRQDWVAYVFSYGGLLFDLLIVPALLWRRTRWIACAAVAFFHISNHFSYPIGIFPWLMLGSTVLYFPPGSFRRFAGGWSEASDKSALDAKLSARRRFVVIALAAYFAFQFAWPLRHHLYPGDAGWTGEGDLFSWRMMLYTKSGETPMFEVRDPNSAAPAEAIDCRRFLNTQQVWSMQLSPDLILQFAHFLHEDIFVPQGFPQVEVHARAPVTYNGRKPQLLVDPKVDLAAVPRRLWGSADWILPLVEPLTDPESVRTRREPAEFKYPSSDASPNEET